MSENSSIIICDQRFDVGQRVITWQEDPMYSAYTPHCVFKPEQVQPDVPAIPGGNTHRFRERRLLGADRSIGRLQQIVKQFVLHLDGLTDSRTTFKVLHDERGLSVHFLIDNNGDIYQTLDLRDCGFHASGVNEISIGVEICNRGDALKGKDPYHGKRDKVTCTINGYQYLSYAFTEAQQQAMVNLGRCLARVLPGLPQEYPRATSGEQLWGTLNGDPRGFAGYLGHYHTTSRKWDPGPFDFQKFVAQIRGRLYFPMVPGQDQAELPEDKTQAESEAQALYDNNEKDGDGGYYPVGPLGASKLWHGGIHLRADRGRPVVAPLGGRIVAARLKAEEEWPAIGSNNMVLLRHDMAIGASQVRFWTLFHHLDVENEVGSEAPGWLKNGRGRPWSSALKAGEVALLDEPVNAGEVIGHFGEAGPRSARAGQIHFAIFAADPIGSQVDPNFWARVDGTRGGRFCAEESITAYIDYNRNGILQPKELVYFFRDPSPQSQKARETFRRLEVRHLSEWADNDGDFLRELTRSREIRALVPGSASRLRQIYADQIESMFFWTDEVGSHAGLPPDKLVWSYHPVTFVLWLNDKLKGQVVASSSGIGSADEFKGKPPPPDIQGGDFAEGESDPAGGFFFDDEDALFGEAAKNLTLEQLAGGYPDK
jgi:N-acetylmuramoyl-L-alanine amidase